MKTAKIIFCFLMLAIVARTGMAQNLDLPQDVVSVIKRITECIYFSGEEPYDKARAREIQKKVQALGCATLAREELTLRGKYQGNAKVLKAIDDAKRAGD